MFSFRRSFLKENVDDSKRFQSKNFSTELRFAIRRERLESFEGVRVESRGVQTGGGVFQLFIRPFFQVHIIHEQKSQVHRRGARFVLTLYT